MLGREQPAITGFEAPLQQLAANTERKNRELRDRTPSDTDNKCDTSFRRIGPMLLFGACQ